MASNSHSEIGSDTALDALRMTSEIVAAYVSNNPVNPGQIPDLIRTVHNALGGQTSLPETSAPAGEKPKPAVPISRSVHHDYIVCLEDGKHLTMLKRYLNSRYGMSPEEYRRKWGLKADYPMVAPAYAARRSEFAKSIGLGKGVRRRS